MNDSTTKALTQKLYDLTGWGRELEVLGTWALGHGYSSDYLLEQMPPQVRVVKLKPDLYMACFDTMSHFKSYAPTPANALGSFSLRLIETGRIKVEVAA